VLSLGFFFALVRKGVAGRTSMTMMIEIGPGPTDCAACPTSAGDCLAEAEATAEAEWDDVDDDDGDNDEYVADDGDDGDDGDDDGDDDAECCVYDDHDDDSILLVISVSILLVVSVLLISLPNEKPNLKP
jgi:hypothetical protein